MTSLYKILKSAKLGVGAAQDFHTAIMAQKMPFAKRSGAEHEYTGAVPVTFTANGQPLLDYLISGNEEHNGTPARDNPIMPQGTGDLEIVGAKAGQYKIPILNNSTTTPVYLGEVQSTRRIMKLVLTGEENWSITSNNRLRIGLSGQLRPFAPICSHYTGSTATAWGDLLDNSITVSIAGYLAIYDTSYDNTSNFKAYLAQQYAAGTPVTIWYVLANEETAVVNEPLMKIGDYADTVSMEQAGVEIPTARGTNTLDVLTDVKPSEIYIKYKE